MSEKFIVYPAIDLRRGKVVRLKEGDPKRQTDYDPSPSHAAKRWLEEGAQWLHVINLDGAFAESDSANYQALAEIIQTAAPFGAKVQFGGGLRSLESIRKALELGVSRAVLGTLAIKQPAVLAEALNTWGADRIAVSLDARDGLVQIKGWQEASSINAVDLALQLKEKGLRWVVFTDIARDGLQSGVNLPATLELARKSGLKVIASGGVKDQTDIDGAREAGLAGIISGRALYEGTLDTKYLFN